MELPNEDSVHSWQSNHLKLVSPNKEMEISLVLKKLILKRKVNSLRPSFAKWLKFEEFPKITPTYYKEFEKTFKKHKIQSILCKRPRNLQHLS